MEHGRNELNSRSPEQIFPIYERKEVGEIHVNYNIGTYRPVFEDTGRILDYHKVKAGPDSCRRQSFAQYGSIRDIGKLFKFSENTNIKKFLKEACKNSEFVVRKEARTALGYLDFEWLEEWTENHPIETLFTSLTGITGVVMGIGYIVN